MKQINLNRIRKNKYSSLGLVAFVDNEDFEYLNKFNWSCYKYKDTFYCVRRIVINGKAYNIPMHREIMGVVDPEVLIDHKDHNGLNNQKSNLRKADKSTNQMNSRSQSNSTSKYLGVSKHISKIKYKLKDGTLKEFVYEKWCANIKVKRKHISLGTFKVEQDAARAYNEAANKYHGEFANLNII